MGQMMSTSGSRGELALYRRVELPALAPLAASRRAGEEGACSSKTGTLSGGPLGSLLGLVVLDEG